MPRKNIGTCCKCLIGFQRQVGTYPDRASLIDIGRSAETTEPNASADSLHMTNSLALTMIISEWVVILRFSSCQHNLYGIIFVGTALSHDAHSRNVCIFANGEVDRSPTGTGVSARLALENSRGRLRQSEPFIVESILGTRFIGRIKGTTRLGKYDAVIPQVEGRAWITGRNEFLISPNGPLKEGFILR
jgi:proline racemase